MSEPVISDIFANWKNKKFVILTAEESGFAFDEQCSHIVILADIGYWASQYSELNTWCELNSCIVKGMTVQLPDESTAVLFELKWA